eukprot:403372542
MLKDITNLNYNSSREIIIDLSQIDDTLIQELELSGIIRPSTLAYEKESNHSLSKSYIFSLDKLVKLLTQLNPKGNPKFEIRDNRPNHFSCHLSPKEIDDRMKKLILQQQQNGGSLIISSKSDLQQINPCSPLHSNPKNPSITLHIFLVLDESFLLRSSKEIVRSPTSNSKLIEKSPQKQSHQETTTSSLIQPQMHFDSPKTTAISTTLVNNTKREFVHWDYRVRGEYFYARPYFDDFVKFLLTLSNHLESMQHVTVKLSLCLNDERKRAIGMTFQMFQNKKLRDFKKSVLSIHDESDFDLSTGYFMIPQVYLQKQSAKQNPSQNYKLMVISATDQSNVKIESLHLQTLVMERDYGLIASADICDENCDPGTKDQNHHDCDSRRGRDYFYEIGKIKMDTQKAIQSLVCLE